MTNPKEQLANISPEKRRQLIARLKARRNAVKIEQIPRVQRTTNTFPLSFAQERVWFIEQMEPGSVIHTIPFTSRIEGPLDIAALRQAFRKIVRRHETLRTSFVTKKGEPLQVISAECKFELPIVDVGEISVEELDDKVGEMVAAEISKPFDLSRPPLLRASLFRRDENLHAILLCLHHIIMDGASISVLLNDLTKYYELFSENNQFAPSELAIQYADYAVWQREFLQGEKLDKELGYWKSKLEGTPGILELPTDRPRPAIQTFRGKSHVFEFTLELSSALKSLARKNGTTLFMTILAAFKGLLFRYSGQEKIVVGTPIANRDRAEIRELIGLFLNNLVLSTDLNDDPTFLELMQRVRETTLGAFKHQDMPFEKLVEELQPERDLSTSPLFQVMFIQLNAPTDQIELSKLKLFPPALQENKMARFDLTLYLDERDGQLFGTFEYNTDLFDSVTIKRMGAHLIKLVKYIVGCPDCRISEIPLQTETEQEQLTARNATEFEYPKEICFHQFFEAQVAKSPEAIAVEFAGRQLSYLQLNRLANGLATQLRQMGVGPNVLVGICVERSLEMMVGLLGIHKAGGAYVPLDPDYPQQRLAYMLEDAATSVLLTQGKLLADLPEFDGPVLYLDHFMQEDEVQNGSYEHSLVDSANLAYVIYTSGSTGKPKGVAIPHQTLVNFLFSMKKQPGITPADTLLAVTTLSFDIAALELFLPLISGAKVVIASREDTADGRRLAEMMSACGVTIMQATPATWRLLLDGGWQNDGNLKMLCGGEALPRELADRLLKTGVDLWNMYGPTETTIWSAICQVKKSESPVQIGPPIANTRLYILDSFLQQTPIGVPGELHISGDGLAAGYLNRPDLTADKFIPDPFSSAPGARMYKTGDLTRFTNCGDIEFLGRIDNQVKVRGFRLELGEIEAVISLHHAVCEVAVTPKEMAPGDVRLVAYNIYENSNEVDTAELREFLAEKLPDYMIPSIFVTMDSFPLTPNGKVDRKNLPLPSGEDTLSSKKFVAPESAMENFIAATWKEILGVDRVGLFDTFFDLGGHSLLSMKVIYRIEEKFSVRINPREVMFNDLRQLAHITDLQVGSNTLSTKIERVNRDTNSFPLSYTQERLWYLEQLDPGTAIYNIPYNIRFDGPLNQAALTKALSAIVQRHETLRTSFKTEEGQPVQIISDQIEFEIPVVDLSHLPESELDSKIAILIDEEARKPFDISSSPLFRATILRINEKVHGLLLNMHHIVVDGQSLEILIEELTVLYQAYAQDKPGRLPDLPIQYVDFATWQKQRFSEEALEKLMAYWQPKLAGMPSTLDLPTARPRPPVQTFPGNCLSITLPVRLTGSLQKLSKSENTTLFMTLLAAFKILLCRYTGQEDIVVGTPVSGRNRFETERLIGCFINNLVLRTDTGGNPTFRQLLARVRQTALDAYSYQDLPFEQLVDGIQPERNLSVSPLFQVMFIYLNAPNRGVELRGLTMTPLLHATQTSKYDLTLYIAEGKDEFYATFEYNTDLFDAATIERMSDHLQTLLTGIVANPDECLADLPLLSTAEYQNLLVGRNNTERNFTGAGCLIQIFESQVNRSPDSIAVEFEGEEFSYRELNSRANQLAHYLQSLGVGPDVLVGFCVERSLDLLVGPLAIMKAGGAYVPLDPSFPRKRLAYMLEDAGVTVLLTQEQLLAELPENNARIVCIDRDRELFAGESSSNPTNNLTPVNLAYVIYTSGSTGKPKGVAIEHRTLANFLNTMRDQPGLTTDDVLLAVTTLSFDIAALELYLPLTVGAQVKLASLDEASNGRRLSDALAFGNVTVMQATPATWSMLLDFGWNGNRQLKILSGGEALPLDLARELLKKGAALWNMYGPTETTIWSMVHQVATGDDFVSIGYPIANTLIYLLDRNQQPVPDGVFGELYIAGDGLARGYLNRPELTAEKFVPDPFSRKPGVRMYRTGDLIRYRSDGSIEFAGRIDHQVKIRGFRIELGEIEAVLAQHQAVREVAVTPKEMAQGDVRLVAYVIYNSFDEPTISELRKFLKEKLPDYMLPSIFVSLEAFPLTPNGKVDRKNLPVPAGMRAEMSEAFEAPDSEMEKYLAAVWEEVLGMKGVSVHDNFFDLGGHSLLSMKVIYYIEKKNGLQINPREVIFKNLRQLATFCDEQLQLKPKSQSNGITRKLFSRIKSSVVKA